MLNEVWIFEASVFNSELDSNFTNSKLDSRNLSQADSWATPRVSWCSAATCRRPVGGIISSLLNRQYVDCAADYSAGIAWRSCTLVRTSTWKSASKRFMRIQQLHWCNYLACNVSTFAAAKRELFSASEVRTLKSNPCQPLDARGPPVLACRSAACTVAVWVVVHLHLEGHGRRCDDARTHAVLRGPVDGHDDSRPARGILLPRHHLVSKVVTTRCRPNGT